ncbi:MAG: tetratricopeptide repeat protein [Dongiaceae bacterium]
MKRKRRKPSAESRSRRRPVGAKQPDERTSAPDRAEANLPPKHHIWIAASAAALIVVIGGLAFQSLIDGSGSRLTGSRIVESVAAATFVGSKACATCHQAEARLWRWSQHKLAMDHATDKSVLGDFSDASFDYYGARSRFFRKDGKFFIETDGPDGALGVFEIKYTFGVEPLQQYLAQFPDGRIQALPFAWDTRPKKQGGERWFHLYPNENIRHNDVHHWTKLNQNWNFMCAECHSTGVHKNYDATSDRFATTWAEISVGCEACHGAGANHVAWAGSKQSWRSFGHKDDESMGLAVRFDERSVATWSLNSVTGNPVRSILPATLRKEVETCGLCHARRGVLSEDWIPGHWLSDTHIVSTLNPQLYHADGQMLDEVYNYGSFKQSKMFAAGVTCSDCHDPHSAKLRLVGDNTCLQCHSADKYAKAAHSHHEGVEPPLACVSCHMPVRTYMVIDERHDHSFRIPRPDLSAKIGTPNACNDCHSNKSSEWAAAAIERWYGPNREGFQNYAEAFHAAWTDQMDGTALLARMAANGKAPAFARASALSELGSHDSPANIELARAGLTDPDPMIRIGALDVLETVPEAQLWPLVSSLLSDPSRGVRIRAVSLLAAVPTTDQPASDRERFERAAAEFVAAQRLDADRPEARSALGVFYAQRSQFSEAEAEYQAALRLNPQYSPAAINLADLYRGLGRDGDSEKVLRTALAVSPRDAAPHHALGLTLVRLKRLSDAMNELRNAVKLDTGQARYAYVYAVALNSAGRTGEATMVLKENLARHPGDRDTLLALITFSRDLGDVASVLEYAKRLARIEPADSALAGLIEELRHQAEMPNGQ